MTKQDEFQQKAKSIETLVAKLEGAADPAVRSAARDLVQALMELHGAGIERMLEIAHEAGDPGTAIIDRFGRDELVRSVLLLYGLHPDDLHTRVIRALEGTQGFLKSNGASAELVSIDEAGSVRVSFQAKSSGCGAGASSVKARIEAALQDAAPDAASILVEDRSTPSLAGSTFVSIAELQSGQAMAALAVPRVQRSGD
jgi:Fe-S cluster biogenesis protein NfuA